MTGDYRNWKISTGGDNYQYRYFIGDRTTPNWDNITFDINDTISKNKELEERKRKRKEGFILLEEITSNIKRWYGLDITPNSNLIIKTWPIGYRVNSDARPVWGASPKYYLKSTKEGISCENILFLSVKNYENRPMYRFSWELKLIMELTKEEIETEVAMHNVNKAWFGG